MIVTEPMTVSMEAEEATAHSWSKVSVCHVQYPLTVAYTFTDFQSHRQSINQAIIASPSQHVVPV